MKKEYRSVRLSKDNLEKLEVINRIVEDYQRQGYKLTLRQLYYQLVSKSVIPNNVTEYAKISKLLKEGRMGGVVDWDAIEDRLRVPYTPASFKSEKDILDAAIEQFQLPRQEGQDNYMEVWVEKDALSGVLKKVTKGFHIPLLVNRGYSSASAMHDAYNRFYDAVEDGQKVIVLYLGDFDPSGKDMIRDITERIKEFYVGDWRVEQNNLPEFSDVFSLNPIALTIDQIKQYSPPPNPAKIKDPRAKEFMQKYGASSWEVDALRPDVLHKLLYNAITDSLDMDRYEEILEKEKAGVKKLKSLKDYL